MQSGFNNKSSIYDRSNSTNTRISMKSAKKINNIFANQQNS